MFLLLALFQTLCDSIEHLPPSAFKKILERLDNLKQENQELEIELENFNINLKRQYTKTPDHEKSLLLKLGEDEVEELKNKIKKIQAEFKQIISKLTVNEHD